MDDFIVDDDDEDDGYDSAADFRSGSGDGSGESGSESDGSSSSSSSGAFDSKAAQSRAAVAASLDDAGEGQQHCLWWWFVVDMAEEPKWSWFHMLCLCSGRMMQVKRSSTVLFALDMAKAQKWFHLLFGCAVVG
jgi:hypothetical protein